MKIIVGKVLDGGKYEYVDAKCSNYDNVSVESKLDLEAGRYIAFVEIDWR